ncbi:MAG TPA: metal-sulfur cluster assembly factor [bacterium]|nr:metal-sulfur cluster assembly factor [bacterium]
MAQTPAPEALTRDQVVAVLRTIYDPEIPVNIYDLGLIYDLEVTGWDVTIKMTLTAVGCPIGPYVAEEIRNKLQAIGADNVVVDFVWSPPWTPDRLSEEGRLALQSMGYPV